MPDPRVLLDSDFRRSAADQTGGHHRHAQLHDLLRGIDPGLAYTDAVAPGRGRLRGAVRAARSLVPAAAPSARGAFRRATWVGYGYNGKIWEAVDRSLRRHPGARCLVNDVLARWAVPHLCQARRLPWVAAPQNLEVLWTGRDLFLGRSFWRGLRFETDLLRTAAHVFTISHEEQFVLANLRIPADCLPYYPPTEQAEWLGTVRTRRADAGPGGYVLFVANFLNPSSADGLRDCVARFLPPPAARPRLVLAGWRSETAVGGLPGVEAAGEVSRERLADLLAGAKALLVHQTYGGGALTRIPEALIAGLPVIANTFAARSALAYEGVHTYDTPAGLADLLNADLPTPPVPPRPVEAERRFREVFEGILKAGAA